MLQAKWEDKVFQKLPAFSKELFIYVGRKMLTGVLSVITTFLFS